MLEVRVYAIPVESDGFRAEIRSHMAGNAIVQDVVWTGNQIRATVEEAEKDGLEHLKERLYEAG